MSGRWSPNSSSINTQLSPLSSIGGMTRCLMLFRHNVTFFGGELLVRGAEHEHRSLRSSFCSEWSRIWFVRVGWRCWRVTYTHFITLNAKTTETTPDHLMPLRKKGTKPRSLVASEHHMALWCLAYSRWYEVNSGSHGRLHECCNAT